MLDNTMQHYWKLIVEKLHHIVPWLCGRMHFAEGGKVFIKTVELSEGSQQFHPPHRTPRTAWSFRARATISSGDHQPIQTDDQSKLKAVDCGQTKTATQT